MYLTTFPAPKLVEFPKPASLAVRDERILEPDGSVKPQFVRLIDRSARSIARKLLHRFDLDDLRSEGYRGLIRAAERYQPSRNVPFEKYASMRIAGAIRDYCGLHGGKLNRKQWHEANHLQLDEEAAAAVIVDPGERPDEAAERSRKAASVVAAMQELDPQERAVIHLVYVRGDTVENVSRRMGVHHTYVSQIRKRAVERMRRHFALRGRKAA